MFWGEIDIVANYSERALVTLFPGDCLELLRQIPNGQSRLIVTSPPYNIGKKYEKRIKFDQYLNLQAETIKECARTLADDGSLCWQVGNHIAEDGEVFPLDIYIYRICKELKLKLRNRIVWSFDHGLHCRRRITRRYEASAPPANSDTVRLAADVALRASSAGKRCRTSESPSY